jgi:uncharacterized coiled-coil protein SlyX
VAKTPIGDRLIRAIETIDELQETLATQTDILIKLADKIDELDQRLAAVEKSIKS